MSIDVPGSTSVESSRRAAGWHSLANGRYTVVITPAGGGVSTFDGFILNPWRADPVEDPGGLIIYARDLATGEFWTLSGRPVWDQEVGDVRRETDELVIERTHRELRSRVAARLHDTLGIEERRCTLTNTGAKSRQIELTSFVEVALNPPQAHESHPAFSKLFIQTASLGELPMLAASRRPRAHGESAPVFLHALLDARVTDFLTDRAQFIGRGRDACCPRALAEAASLGRSHGNVLDPALSLRSVLRVEPGASCTLRFVLAAGYDASELGVHLGALRKTTLDGLATAARDDRSAAARNGSDDHARLMQRLMHGYVPRSANRLRSPPGPAVEPADPSDAPPTPLQYFNGYGGFSRDGSEYVLRIPADARQRPQLPPAPWTNVIANPTFGCLISESGAGTTWSRNSREHRLTPWSNDPVIDPHGDALYVRDEESGRYWSPMPGPAAALGDFEVHHGFGYSTWHHRTGNLEHETTVFVDEAAPARLARIRITNRGAQRRQLALYSYNRWVLGTTPESTRSQIRVQFSDQSQAVLARNAAAADGFACVAFAAADRPRLDGWCGDRAAFLGVPGSPAAPAALGGDGQLPASRGDDPCAVLRIRVDLDAGATDEVTFLLGAVDTEAQVAPLLSDLRRPGRVDESLQRMRAHWQRLFSRLQIDTPSAGLNFMVNGWLPYQDIACRIWARSAFYQSGGAFGFRDQLQDAAAMIYLRPDLTRSQILLHAAHQFVEGDVLHWWHPPHDKGLRTRFADDLLWLPWVTAHYVDVTGDRALLDERVPYVTAPALAAGEAEVLVHAVDSGASGDLYEHCCRALDRSLTRGAHGLPLFGAGDWNDGMNRVGHGGRGESVWMGFFLVTVLDDFLPLCELRGDAGRAARYRQHCAELRTALNAEGWDGAWYRRGWYDNGAVLGSKASDECRIDALAQAWAVISKSAPADRAATALDSLEQHLIDADNRIVRLLDPPFVDTVNDPGYIKGYVAGVRENGGQYTHAALWVVKALAEAGRRERAGEILDWLLPHNHSLDRAAADKYKVEPYVVAADIYGAAPHVGRGGWTWYTGSAGWMYRVAVETILGFSIEAGTTLRLHPRIPDAWPEARLRYRLDDGTQIEISIVNPDGCAERIVRAQFDGRPLALDDGVVRLALPRTAGQHQLMVVMGQ